jgi:nucleotide-binding universal stress UspA family protein
MANYRKILVAIDGSDSSLNALKQAFRLAIDEKCWITVSSVVPEYKGDLDLTAMRDIHEALMQPGREILSQAKEVARLEGALIKTVLEEGEIYERIVDLSEAENCGIIVIGRRGKSPFPNVLIGSTTARVIGHSQRDVLVVPANTKIGWDRILVATDGSKNSRTATDKAIDFAGSYGGKLTVVSVVDVPAELYGEAPSLVEQLAMQARNNVFQVKKKAEAAGVPVQAHVREGESYQTIIKFADEEKTDMIIMGSHGRTGLKRLLMGSVTEKVIGNAPCPVLIAKS